MNLPIQPFSPSIDWQQAIAVSPLGIVIADAQQPDFPAIYANSAFERETGYTAAEVLGKNFRFLQGSDRDQPAIEEMRQALKAKTSCTVILRNYRKDGTLFWNELTLSPILNEQGDMIQVVGIQNDISDRIQAETAQQIAKAQYRSIFEFASDGISIISLETGKVVAANPAMYKMHGYSYEEFMEIEPKRFIHPDSYPFFEQYLTTIHAGEIFECEAIDLRKDGTSFEIEVRGNLCWIQNKPYALSIIRDISERVRLEAERDRLAQEQKASQALLERVINNIPQLIFWKDRHSVYLGCNQKFATAAGFDDPSEIIGKTDYDLPWTTAEAEWFRNCDAEVMESGLPQLHIIETQQQADGQQIWADTSKIPLRNDQNTVIGILGTYDDITDRKQAEAKLRYQAEFLKNTLEELQRTQAQLIQSEKMSSLGQLVAGVAHEINNPVSFIYSNLNPAATYIQDLLHLLDLYQQHYPNPAAEIQAEIEAIELDFLKLDLPKLLQSMKTGAERIREIVCSLRTFSRLDEADLKAVNLHEGIESTLMILKHRLKATDQRPAIVVQKQYSEIPPIECYPGSLNQVFMNLLANAIEAIEEHQTSDLTITITTEVSDDAVQIRIADTGVGMSNATQARIFDPFFTTKPIGVGTGMGLAISYQIITEQHHGSLYCQSEPGQGTEFILAIPLIQPNPDDLAKK